MRTLYNSACFIQCNALNADSWNWAKEHTSVLTALLGNIDVLITWLMNANYITAYLMPEMPIPASREFSQSVSIQQAP